jgi:Fur family transcriptional regulator, peroxide stress response regulator
MATRSNMDEPFPVMKHSKQRDSIITYLMSTKLHPTADKVYEEVRKEYPSVSLGTVYRNLGQLSKMKIIQKLDCGDGIEHFDGNPLPHNHFLCKKCGKVLDLPLNDDLSHIEKLAQADFDGRIEAHSVMFYGTCAQCIKNIEKNK